MKIEIGVLIAVVGMILSVATFFFGRQSAANSNGREMGALLTEVGYIKSTCDHISQKLEAHDERFIALSERLSSVEQSAAAAHHRLDVLAGKNS